uniref:DUF4806 domain-containing protein n=1 Tax=Anopheles melas TaxID=34690 RepID=A0A182TKG4_9DIPT
MGKRPAITTANTTVRTTANTTANTTVRTTANTTANTTGNNTIPASLLETIATVETKIPRRPTVVPAKAGVPATVPAVVATDAPAVAPPLTDVLQVITELSATINRRFDEFAAEFVALKKEVMVTRKTGMATEVALNKLQKIVCADPDGYALPATDGFTLQPIRSEEELKSMEQKLTDKQHVENCLAWLQNEVMATDPTKRLREVRDLVFDSGFISRCRWSKRNEKVSMAHFPNVCELFRKAAAIWKAPITTAYVVDFFKRVLRYPAKSKNANKEVMLNVNNNDNLG